MDMIERNDKHKIKISLSVYVNVAGGIVFILAAALIILFINSKMRENAILAAEAKAKILLDRNLATHTYFTHQLKPSVFKLAGPYRSGEYFDPAWMSSTFAVREIDKYFKLMETEDYYYKECAVNARSPENEADDFEKGFINEINKNPKTILLSTIRELSGKPYFVVMRRGEIMEKSCLRCHDTPELAPTDLVKRYGPERSFSRQLGEVVSAISIRIPLEVPYARADRFSLHLSGLMLLILSILFVLQYLIHKWIVLSPLKQIQHKTNRIAKEEEFIGEQIPPSRSKELHDLTLSFNSMSKQLRGHIDRLEDTVKERTKELSTINEQLKEEINIRKKSEAEKEDLIKELEKALQEIKTLKGILPLCSYCKKIRNDRGEWEDVDAYIHIHSEADVSHSICPDCLKIHYPNL